MAAIERTVTVDDVRRLALRRLPRFISDYVERGAGDGEGARRNVDALRAFRLVPRGLVDVTPVDTTSELFGRTYASGFGVSAVGAGAIYRPGADELLARAAADANLPFILSGNSTTPIEAIARVAPDHTWYQLYASRAPEQTDRTVDRAQDVGVQVLVFTVDFPVPPRSEVSARTGVSLASGLTRKAFPGAVLDALMHPRWTADFLRSGGLPKAEDNGAVSSDPETAHPASLNPAESWCNPLWSDLDRIRRRWRGKLVVKGLVHPDDVLRARSAGADAVTISNHGGGKLDCMPAAVESLVDVRSAVDRSFPLFFDGGLRRGSDLVVARALGADYTFVGRPTLYGVAAAGYAGVRRVLDILQSDLAYTLAMIGCKRLSDVTPHHLAARPTAVSGVDCSPGASPRTSL